MSSSFDWGSFLGDVYGWYSNEEDKKRREEARGWETPPQTPEQKEWSKIALGWLKGDSPTQKRYAPVAENMLANYAGGSYTPRRGITSFADLEGDGHASYAPKKTEFDWSSWMTDVASSAGGQGREPGQNFDGGPGGGQNVGKQRRDHPGLGADRTTSGVEMSEFPDWLAMKGDDEPLSTEERNALIAWASKYGDDAAGLLASVLGGSLLGGAVKRGVQWLIDRYGPDNSAGAIAGRTTGGIINDILNQPTGGGAAGAHTGGIINAELEKDRRVREYMRENNLPNSPAGYQMAERALRFADARRGSGVTPAWVSGADAMAGRNDDPWAHLY